MKKILVLFALLYATSCEQNSDSFTDSRDGKKYKAVKMGDQIWMAENLNFEAKESKCYDNKPANCEKYGRLYEWETAKTACPKGWHLPVNDEWETLSNYLGGKKLPEVCECSKEYEKMGKLKEKDGFAALLGGRFYIDSDDEEGNERRELGYDSMDSLGAWFSASPGGHESGEVWIFKNDEIKSDYLLGEVVGFSVRCVKD